MSKHSDQKRPEPAQPVRKRKTRQSCGRGANLPK